MESERRDAHVAPGSSRGPGPPGRRRGHPRRRPGPGRPPDGLPPALPAPVLPRRAARHNATLVIRGRLSGLERKTSEPIAIEAGLPRKPIQFFVGAGKWDDEAVMAELRAARPRGAGRARRRRGHRPQRLPQEGDRVLRRRPPVVRPARQGRQLPGRRLPGLRRRGRLRPAGPPALPARGLGRRRGPPREVPRPPGGRVPGEVADRPGPAGPEPARLAPRLDRRRRRVRPGLRVPRRAAPAAGALRPGRAVQHHGARPGAAPPAAQEGRRRPQARGAVRAGRRLGGGPAGVAVGADDGPRRREGAAAWSMR